MRLQRGGGPRSGQRRSWEIGCAAESRPGVGHAVEARKRQGVSIEYRGLDEAASVGFYYWIWALKLCWALMGLTVGSVCLSLAEIHLKGILGLGWPLQAKLWALVERIKKEMKSLWLFGGFWVGTAATKQMKGIK